MRSYISLRYPGVSCITLPPLFLYLVVALQQDFPLDDECVGFPGSRQSIRDRFLAPTQLIIASSFKRPKTLTIAQTDSNTWPASQTSPVFPRTESRATQSLAPCGRNRRTIGTLHAIVRLATYCQNLYTLPTLPVGTYDQISFYCLYRLITKPLYPRNTTTSSIGKGRVAGLYQLPSRNSSL